MLFSTLDPAFLCDVHYLKEPSAAPSGLIDDAEVGFPHDFAAGRTSEY